MHRNFRNSNWSNKTDQILFAVIESKMSKSETASVLTSRQYFHREKTNSESYAWQKHVTPSMLRFTAQQKSGSYVFTTSVFCVRI